MDELTDFPATFAAGETVSYLRSNADFPASGGWTMVAGLRGKGGANATVTPDGDDYLVVFADTDTKGLPAGQYKWVEKFTHTTLGVKAVKGDTVVTPDVFAAADGELQSQDEKILAAIDDALLGRITRAQARVTLDSMGVEFDSLLDLERLRVVYQARVNSARAGGQGIKVTRVTFRKAS